MSWVLLCLMAMALWNRPGVRIRGATGSDAAWAAVASVAMVLAWAAVCLGLLAGALCAAGHL